MSRRWMALVVAVVLVAFGPAVRAEEWSPPVDGPVVRGYEPPDHPFGARHLGVDYAARPGTPVRAAGDGIVAFAGRVGRASSVAVEHPGARRTTYAYLREVAVRAGSPVRRGDQVGLSGGRGPGHSTDVVHFGYRVAGIPQDPALLFARSPRISLAPLDRPACPTRRTGVPFPQYPGEGTPVQPGPRPSLFWRSISAVFR